MKVLFLDGTKGFSPTRLKDNPCGGILGSLTIIPKFLASKGHEVYVKSVFDKSEKIDGVQYLSSKEESKNVDVIVFNRNLLNDSLITQAKHLGAKTVWWLHDIVDHRYLLDGAFKKVDSIISLSRYCTDTYSMYYGIDREKFVEIPNGVDKSVFYPGSYSKKKRGLFVYASAPIKGMKPLAFTIQNLKRVYPQSELWCYSSQKLHDLIDDALIKHYLDQLKWTDGVRMFEPVPQGEMADVLRQAWGLLMPNSYPEICSNLTLQALASGTPVISSPLGSAAEFIENGQTGYITKSSPNDMYYWWAEYAKCVAELTMNEKLHKEMSENATKDVKGWDEIGQRWESHLLSLLK